MKHFVSRTVHYTHVREKVWGGGGDNTEFENSFSQIIKQSLSKSVFIGSEMFNERQDY
jgi:hypothetical protein